MNGEVDNQPLTKKQRRALRREERRLEVAKGHRKGVIGKIVVVASVVVVIGGIGWLIVKGGGGATTPLAPDNDPFKGSVTAKVVINEFSDLQCPACKAAEPVIKQVIDTYGDKIKFIYNNFPIPSHQNGRNSAIAGECAFDQGKFWEFHDLLFDKQDTWGNISNPKDTFVADAISLGMDGTKFAACYDGSDAKKRVDYDESEGNAAGVNSTPTFIINGQKIVGAQPFEEFKKVIDAKLSAVQ